MLVISILILLNFSFLFFTFIFELFFRKKHIFYPTVLFLGFSLINSIFSLYFIYKPELIYVFSGGYNKKDLIVNALLIYLFVNILVYLQFVFFLSARIRLPRIKQDLLGNRIFSNTSKKTISIVFFAIGLFFYFFFVSVVGGFSNIFSNIGARQDVYSGYGYLMRFATILLQFVSLLVFVKFYSKNRLISLIAIIISVVLLLMLGSRTSAFGFLFAFIVTYHFTIKPLKLKLYYLPLGLFFLVAAVALGDLRTKGEVGFNEKQATDLAVQSFFESLLPYAFQIRRDVTILEYFSGNEYWYGKSYSSVLLAPIPRALYADKPPVDTGRYVVAMQSGFNINPPVPSNNLPNYGWPPSLMEGYMNFGYIGLIFIVTLSVLVISLVYKLILFRPSIPVFIIYSSLMFRGVTYFDSLSIVSTLTLVLVLYFIVFVYKLLSGVVR